MRAEDLFFRKNLVLGNIDHLEAFVVSILVSVVSDDVPPVLVVGVDQILNLEPDSALKFLRLSIAEQLLANIVSVVKVDDLGILLLLVL